MGNSYRIGIIGGLLFLCGCASYSTTEANNDEQIDIYLSTLDDKHFVWCELDLEQCRRDFEEWKHTTRGKTLIREFEKEDVGNSIHSHHVPNVFRTGFVDESQFVKEVEAQDTVPPKRPIPAIKEMPVMPQVYGPENSPDTQSQPNVP